METKSSIEPPCGVTAHTLALQQEMASGAMPVCHRMNVAGCTIELRKGTDSLWVVVTRGREGGFALRSAYSPGPPITIEKVTVHEGGATVNVKGSLGEFLVELIAANKNEAALRCIVTLTPSSDLLVTSWPRDLYPVTANGSPIETVGKVRAAQRGLNGGVVYYSLEKPCFGSVLYLQNFTALNDYFTVTQTRPDGCVGGTWPELGYQMPCSDCNPLVGGSRVVVSDALVRWDDRVAQNARQSATMFLDLLAGSYAQLARPKTKYHNWPALAIDTLNDLQNSTKVTIEHYGHTYIHPYAEVEYPDSMVQLTVLLPIREYASWRGREIPFAAKLRGGVGKFFDAKLKTVRRYLPNVGKDKDKDAVDSWYLYHPLANLGRLAGDEDKEAERMFLQSLDFAIKVAHHFRYQWPVQFNVQTLSVITGERKPNDPGQSDVGGLYAYVMLQAHRLTGEDRYLREAKLAIDALSTFEFQLEYQANITGWGANACLGIFQITGDESYLEQSYVFLAGFFHNCILWESQQNHAKHYQVFLGATCLHDGPYMALYECYEVFAAFHEYLGQASDHIPKSVQLLLSEYCKYALSRAWYFYPAHLPQVAIAKDVKNGEIDRRLAFPLEDLYADGQTAGKIGQEIYGSGAAFAFTTRAYHKIFGGFTLFCEYPVADLERKDSGGVRFRALGADGFSCDARLLPGAGKPNAQFVIKKVDGEAIRHRTGKEGQCEFTVPANSLVEIRWT